MRQIIGKMEQRQSYKLSNKERKDRISMLKTPLKKMDDLPSVDDIIKDDAMLVRVAFISNLMVRNCTNQQMKEQYEKNFEEEISIHKIVKLRNAARMVYYIQIAQERDAQIAEELMKAEWEARELMEAWDRSKDGTEKKIKHKANSNGSEMMTYDLDEETTQTDRNAGDVKYLEQLGKVRQRVINILGLEAPKQQPTQTTMPSVTINVVDKQQKSILVEDVKVSNE